MHKLIITADDYGMCESVNRAVEACAAAGAVLSTNVMSNMDHAQGIMVRFILLANARDFLQKA